MKMYVALALIAASSAMRMQTEQQHRIHVHVPFAIERDMSEDQNLLAIAQKVMARKETAEEEETEDGLISWLKKCSNGYDGLTWPDVKIIISEMTEEKNIVVKPVFMALMRVLFNKIDTDGNGIVSVQEMEKFMEDYRAKKAAKAAAKK